MNQSLKNYLLKITEYNFWANKRISNMIDELEEERLTKEIISSFPSIKQTLIHIWDAQTIWLKRLKNETVTDWPGKNFSGTKSDLLNGFLNSSEKLYEFVYGLIDKDEYRIINYLNLKGEKFSTSVSDIIIHCVNHSTFHRGQIITMLRQVGKTTFTSTDFINYMRK